MKKRICVYLSMLVLLMTINACDSNKFFTIDMLDGSEDYIIFGTGPDGCEEGEKILFLLTSDAVREISDKKRHDRTCSEAVFIAEPLPHGDFVWVRRMFDVPEKMLKQEYNPNLFDNQIQDQDYYWGGRIEGNFFEYSTDGPVSSEPQELSEYFELYIDCFNWLVR